MVNYISTNSDYNRSPINIIHTPSNIIIQFDKKHYEYLKNVPESKNNGIYILYNHEKYYIGQNSSQNGLIQRLGQHVKQKDWWTHGIAFNTKSELFTKAEYDYIERILIQRFKSKNIPITNKNNGNISPISNENKNKCEIFMSQIITTLNRILNLDIFDLNKQLRLEHIVNLLLDGKFDDEY